MDIIIPKIENCDEGLLKKIEGLFCSEYGVHFSNQRHIEVMREQIKKVLFQESIGLKEKQSLQKFSGIYGMTKALFQEKGRNDGGRYFDHLLRVAYYVIYKSKKPSIEKIFIAMHHDSIEDTNKTYEGVSEDTTTYVGLGVLLISKPPFKNFIDDRNDLKTFNQIKKSGILNRKGLIRDSFKTKILSNDILRISELDALDKYKKLENKYKEKRNNYYFSKMLNLDTFIRHAKELIEENDIYIDVSYDIPDDFVEEERQNIIKKICYDALEVKFWDRIDNLKTEEVYKDFSQKNIKKANRKIAETKKFFYDIALEYDSIHGTEFYTQIKYQVEFLENFIKDENFRKVIQTARENISKIISNAYFGDDEAKAHTMPSNAVFVGPGLII